MYLIASFTNQFPLTIVSKQIPEHFSCFAIEIAEMIAFLDMNCENALEISRLDFTAPHSSVFGKVRELVGGIKLGLNTSAYAFTL